MEQRQRLTLYGVMGTKFHAGMPILVRRVGTDHRYLRPYGLGLDTGTATLRLPREGIDLFPGIRVQQDLSDCWLVHGSGAEWLTHRGE